MKLRHLLMLSLLAASLLLFGCTANPQDIAPQAGSSGAPGQPGSATTGASGQQGNTGETPVQTGNGSQAEQSNTNNSSQQVVLSLEEVAKHSTQSDCWLVISGKVYDLSSFSKHAGGTAFVPFCGKDATTAFQTKVGKGQNHSANAYSFMPNFEIGALGSTVTPKSNASQNQPSSQNSSNLKSGNENENEYGED